MGAYALTRGGPARKAALGLAGALSVLPMPALAQDIVNGEHIVKTRCAVCHTIDAEHPVAGNRGAAPSFSNVAQRQSVNKRFLDSFLGTPHAGMPDFYLTYSEIQDVSAYIISLRR